MAQVRYTSEIFAGKDGPMFRVTAANDGDNPKIATTATGAWKQVQFCCNCRPLKQSIAYTNARALDYHVLNCCCLCLGV